MKTYKINTLVILSLMITSLLSGCVRKINPTSSSESGGESSSETEEGFILSAVDQKDEFVSFLANRNIPSTKPDGFKTNDRAYTVGDDNPFNVKPEIALAGEITGLPVDSSKWTYDFTITARKQGSVTDASSDEFEVVDAANCDVQFKAPAIGHTYTISVAPTHVDASKVAQFTKTFTVDVVDGYNVYSAKELGYLDTRELNSNVGEEGGATKAEINFVNKWQEFKTQNGLNPDIKPSALIFHSDLNLTKNDIPSNFFYTSAQATAIGAEASVAGSLLDRAYVYTRSIPGNIEINGNYFGLDYSEIPLIQCAENEPTAPGQVVAHSSLIKVNDGTIEVKNLKVTGNAPRAVNDGDTIRGGGLMFMKAASKATSAKLDNMIVRSAYITVMTEKPDDGYPVLDLLFDNTKCSNNYNSFLYSWAGHIIAKNSDFSNCGGPIIIQDHFAPGEVYEGVGGLVVNGYAPSTTFIDCSLENYVAGTEAWFQSFGVATLASMIKEMSNLLLASGLGKGFVVNEAHKAVLYDKNLQTPSFFNFIVVNKSSIAEGLTPYGVCGQVKFLTTKTADDPNTTEDETEYTTDGYFDYRQPAYNEATMSDAVVQAFFAYQVASEEQKEAAATNLVTALTAAGVDFGDDYSSENIMSKTTEYLTALCMEHGVIRGLNNAGAPVFDFGAGLPLGTTDGETGMYEALSFAAYMQHTSEEAPQTYAEAIGTKKVGDFMSVYFNGVMLSFKLYPVAA